MTTNQQNPIGSPGRPVGFGVIGVGLIGSHHASNLARRVPGARLVALADPEPGLAERTAAALGCATWTRDLDVLLANAEVEAVVIASPAAYHADTIVAAAQAGKAIFCEKPLASTLADADRAIRAVRAAAVPFQIGFQRRFDAAYARARQLVARGELGQIQLLRSLTRDPSLDQPERVTPGAIFLETLIHDFDVLRFLAGGAEPIEVYASADALILPDWKARGMLDTAVVSLRYDSGAMATADASFQAVYGYDVRAEVFGSEGMASVGDDLGLRLVHHARAGSTRPRPNWFIDVFGDAYAEELRHFAAHVRSHTSAGASRNAAAAGSVPAAAAGAPRHTTDAAASLDAAAADAPLDDTASATSLENPASRAPLHERASTASLDDATSAASLDDAPAAGSLDDAPAAGSLSDAPAAGSLDDAPAAGSLDDARAALVLALAAWRSAESRRPVFTGDIRD
jgi:myo-inositol 2-dehydrogenase / D-chiro-inositol 1-dehydrogenase